MGCIATVGWLGNGVFTRMIDDTHFSMSNVYGPKEDPLHHFNKTCSCGQRGVKRSISVRFPFITSRIIFFHILHKCRRYLLVILVPCAGLGQAATMADILHPFFNQWPNLTAKTSRNAIAPSEIPRSHSKAQVNASKCSFNTRCRMST